MRLFFATLAVFAFIFATASSIRPQSAIERAKRRFKLVTRTVIPSNKCEEKFKTV